MKDLPHKRKLREFGLLFGLAFPILIGFLIPYIAGHSFKVWTLFIGIPSLILATIQPKLLFWPYKFWMALGHILGFINSRFILGLIFLLVLQPIALIMKIFGYDPLRKKRKNKNTYREVRLNSIINMEKIF